jgi:glycosyltransferase involved in cell wall biosynthesis
VKVLQIHSRYREYGGEERVVETDSALLRAAGHEVMTHEVPNPSGGVSAAASLAASSWNLRQAGKVRKLIEGWQPDVVHIHNTWFSLSPSVPRAVSQAGLPLVQTIHNYRPTCVNAKLFRDGQPCYDCLGSRLPWKGVRLGCYRESRVLSAAVVSFDAVQRLSGTWEASDLITVQSERHRELLERGGLDAPTEVLPWTTRDPGPRKAAPSASNEVLFLGRLEPEIKGIERLVRAWNIAHASGALGNLHLTLVGTGDLLGTPALEGDSIRAVGWMDQEALDRLMLSSRALLFPSTWEETFGLVAIEGFAAGLPVLGSDLGGIRDTVGRIDPDCLVSTDPGDEEAWVRALGMLRDDGWVDRKGADARMAFEDEFCPEVGLRRLLAAYGRAAARRAEMMGSL